MARPGKLKSAQQDAVWLFHTFRLWQFFRLSSRDLQHS